MADLIAIKEQIKEFLSQAEALSPLSAPLLASVQSGKMLRSKLALAVSDGLQNQLPGVSFDARKLVILCAIIELIQSASLLHDDVIDDATTRRGAPSVNASFGAKNAVMLGDVLYALGFARLGLLECPQASRIVADAVATLALGEIEDVAMSAAFNAESAAYLAMIEHKTAALIAASAQAAALLCGASEQQAAAFGRYGRALGMAFQIIDDVLDITQDAASLGKPALSDFKEGKTTLPYIYLHERLDSAGRARLVADFGRELAPDEQAWILGELGKCGAIDRSLALARDFGRDGLEAIRAFACGKLEQIMKEMIEREF